MYSPKPPISLFVVLFCNSSRRNSPVKSETANVRPGVSFEKFSVRSGELRISEILRMPVFTDWILYGLEDNP